MNAGDIPTDLHAAFARQRAAFAGAPFPDSSVRADRLRRLARLLTEHEAAICDAVDKDFGGRPRIETELAEIWPGLEELKTAAKQVARWMKPRHAGVSKWFFPASAAVMPQPLGVVGIIVPWNYPLYLAVAPMAAALAAGNRVMVKMSEFTPAFSTLFRSLCAQVFSDEEICIVSGGPDVAAQFSALPFDHLLFTGSAPVGRKVMGAAAANLTPVTLELGGKSPAVIAPAYPLRHAVERILAGKLLNAGQTCIAPDYLLLPRSALDEFVATAHATARRLYPAGLADGNYCSVVNDRQYRRLTAGLDELAERGTRVEALFSGAARDDTHHRLAPVLVIDPPLDSAIMREEIFGPPLPVIPYDDIDDAIGFINARARPLALYWFDRDAGRVERALRLTHAGGVCVNETLLHVAQHTLPFGGVGPSGMGHYHGRWGFDTFSKLKPVFRQTRLNGLKLFLPPYSTPMRRLLAIMKRH